MQTPIYSKWMNSLGPDVQHIIVNGTGPQLPHVVEPYRNQHVHRLLQPNVFPPLVAADFDTILQQVQ